MALFLTQSQSEEQRNGSLAAAAYHTYFKRRFIFRSKATSPKTHPRSRWDDDEEEEKRDLCPKRSPFEGNTGGVSSVSFSAFRRLRERFGMFDFTAYLHFNDGRLYLYNIFLL